MDRQWLAVGQLGKPKGLNGALFFNAYNPSSESLFQVATVKVGEEEFTVDEYITGGKRPVVRFLEVFSIDQAKRLVGQELWVKRSELPQLKSGQFYVGELVGFDVRSKEKILGKFSGVLSTPSNDIYVVKGTSGEVLLPVIPGVVENID